MVGTRGHSTVSLDGRDQAERVGRFVWVTRPTARNVRFDLDAHEAIAEVAWPEGLGTHRRTIIVERWGWTILDEVRARHAARARLHWLLCDASWSCAGVSGSSWRFEAELERIRVSVRVTCVGAQSAPRMVRARDEPDVGGWFAPKYAWREPAVSVVWEEPARDVMTWVTEVRCTSS